FDPETIAALKYNNCALLLDVNECTADNGGCEGQCCNTIGSFYCKCPKGMRLSQDGKACEGKGTFVSQSISIPLVSVSQPGPW
uniref:EGF-like calcium-binding domain-containing protein n=1 Tax=Paramormyrops kingsleyae TaxID=1676925 RepID=A0A3B3TA77_9TELE